MMATSRSRGLFCLLVGLIVSLGSPESLRAEPRAPDGDSLGPVTPGLHTEVHTYFVAGHSSAAAVWVHNRGCGDGDDLVTVFRVQRVGEGRVIGGAFQRLRESGSSLADAGAARAKLLAEVNHASPGRRVRALQDAQASGSKSPFISTTFDSGLAFRTAHQLRRQTGEAFEVVAIRGPRSGGVDFEAAFAALGGRRSPSRFKDAELQEFGILDLFIPASGRSKSGFEIIGRHAAR